MSRRICVVVIACLSVSALPTGTSVPAAESKSLPAGSTHHASKTTAVVASAAKATNKTKSSSTPFCAGGLTLREGDQLWMVSCRGMGCRRPSQFVGNLKYSVYTPELGWQPSTRNAFFANRVPQVQTTFFAHGNQIDNSEAQRVAINVYRSLADAAPPDQSLHFVLWSWPSERTSGGLLADVRTKAQRTPAAGYYLGWLVDQFPADSRITLIGYSFGARIVTGALHLVGGGRLAGDLLLDPKKQRKPVGAILMAAAVDDTWLRPGMPHGLATTQVDRLLFINNSADSALRHYHLLYGLRHTADAMGTYGPAGYAGGAFVIDKFDAACIVGKEHDWKLYFGSPTIMRRMQPAVFATSGPLQFAGKQARSAAKPAAKSAGSTPQAGHASGGTIKKIKKEAA
jgi:hypothetical protein